VHTKQNLKQLSFLFKATFFVSFHYTWRHQITQFSISKIIP